MKRYFIYAITALLMMGCVDERQIEDSTPLAYDPSKVICITTTTGKMQNAEMTTRGTPINDVADMTDFGAFCYKGTDAWGSGQAPNKMYNRKLIQNASGAWEYDGTAEPWDDTTGDNLYSFFAYAPYATGTGTTGNGIMVTSTNVTVGVPTLSYTVPIDVTKQPDLMVAEPRYDLARQYKAVAMKMNHALTCVGFQVSGNGEKVTAIKIKGVYNSGTLPMNGSAINWTHVGGVNTTNDYSASIKYDASQSYFTATTTMQNLLTDNGYLMMIPQTLGTDAKVIITYDGQDLEFSLDTHTWEAGKRVIYNINIEAQIMVSPVSLVIPHTGTDGSLNNIEVTTSNASKSWTLQTPAAWLELSLDPTGATKGSSVTGTGNQTVYTFANANTTAANLTTTITLNGATDVVVKVTQLHAGGGLDVLDGFYIGAFWRAEQTGERILRNTTNTTPWILSILWKDSNWAADDIMLAAGLNSAYTDFAAVNSSPGNAENYEVATADAETLLSGTGTIEFRIGLKTTWDNTAKGSSKYNSSVPARYAVLVLSYGTDYGSHQKIFLRQGHEADYVMRNGVDAGTAIAGWDGTRNKSVKFSPYNLTAPEYKTDNPLFDGSDVVNHATIPERTSILANDVSDYFTDYPSQAGAFFQWAGATTDVERKAYHPTKPASSIEVINGWAQIPIYVTWNSLSAKNETCPPGWRRPNDGSITTTVNSSTNVTNSEMRQSLWLNPQNSYDSNVDNSIWGYYADGYFDRQEIENSVSGTATGSAVSPTSSIPAYRGRLFFNPTTNASLFFPAAGLRYHTSQLDDTGSSGHFWSTAWVDGGSTWFMALYLDSAFQSVSYLSYGLTIRCVQESILPDVTLDPYDPTSTDLK